MCFPLFGLLLAILITVFPAAAQPALEKYGNLPEIRSIAISPDGEKVGFLRRVQDDGTDREIVAVMGMDGEYAFAGDVTNLRVRSFSFANPDYALLKASQTTRIFGYRGRLDYDAALSIDFENKKINQLFQNTPELYPAQEGLGRIVGVHPTKPEVYIPAWAGSDTDNDRYVLWRVNLRTGRGRIHANGTDDSKDFFVNDLGKVLAREDFNDERNKYKIYSYISGKQKEIFATDASAIPFYVAGVTPDHEYLVLRIPAANTDYDGIGVMSLEDGKIRRVFGREDSEISHFILDQNRHVYGVAYDGLQPTYTFFVNKFDTVMKRIMSTFDGLTVELIDWSDDFSKLIIFVSGSNFSPAYFMYDDGIGKLLSLGNAYDISDEQVAELVVMNYKARDGLGLNAVLTRPVNFAAQHANGKKFPLIVMPHGGPASHDVIGFDWMAQFFASRGYMVLQPNFRGSTGFGRKFRNAGDGEWGLKMQDDVTDGVLALKKLGWIDEDRVCIVGASYGGYSALAGGAYTPDLYECVVAIAPVSDLPQMLSTEKRDFGRKSSVYEYWTRLIGDPKNGADKLKEISPAYNAENFKAPVLLIHGKDDLVVPIRQSQIMERALRKAGKDVEFVTLKGEDHYLSMGKTRIETLRVMNDFISRIIGDNAAPKVVIETASFAQTMKSNAIGSSGKLVENIIPVEMLMRVDHEANQKHENIKP